MDPIKIAKAKKKLIIQLNNLRNEYLVNIYKLLLNNHHNIHTQLLKDTISYRKLPQEVNLQLMNKTAVHVAVKLENSNLGGLLLFLLLDRLYHAFAKPIQETANNYENLLKGEYLSNLVNNARELGNVFYLCSKHLDSAKDHEPYQGKIYIDNHFDFYDKNSIDIIKSGEYETIQNIINAPVRLITRNNCRHYFRAISTKELLNNTIDDLLNKYGMIHKVGPRNSNNKIEAMERKLEFYQQLYKVNNATYIKNFIIKYKKFIQEHKK